MVGWKMWALCMFTSVLGVVVGVTVSVQAADRSFREQETRAEKTRADGRQATCQVVGTILAAYEDEPPTTAAGRNVADAWLYEYRVLGCTPTK